MEPLEQAYRHILPTFALKAQAEGISYAFPFSAFIKLSYAFLNTSKDFIK